MTPVTAHAAGLGTRAARYTLIAVWALGIWSQGQQGALHTYLPQLLVALFLQLGAVLLVTFPGNGRLPWPLSILCLTSALLSGAIVLLTTTPPGEWWPFSFAAYLVALLTPRGNVWEGVSGGILLVIAGITFGIVSDTAAPEVFALIVLPMVALIIGLVWRVTLTSSLQREQLLHTQAELAQLAIEASHAATKKGQAMITEVRSEASEALSRIHAGSVIDETDRLEFALIEAGIRDRLRSPQLRHQILNESVRAARERDIRVLLLGSDSMSDFQIPTALATAVATTVSSVQQGSVIVRAMPHRGEVALVVTINSELGSIRHSFDWAGHLVEQQ